MDLEALKRTYASDLGDWDAFFVLVAAEVHRRFSAGASVVWLNEVTLAVSEDVWEILAEAGCDDFEGEFDPCAFGIESGDVWTEHAKNLLTFCDNVGGCDHLSVLDFGDGGAFLALDNNPDRGLDDYEIEGEIDLRDERVIRELVRSHLHIALGAGDQLGRCPDDIRFHDPVAGNDIRSVTVGLFISNIGVAREYSEWMTERDHGVWPFNTEDERAALADAYLEIALGYSPTEYSITIEPDESGGLLLSELLEADQSALDRISRELTTLRDEIGDPSTSNEKGGSTDG